MNGSNQASTSMPAAALVQYSSEQYVVKRLEKVEGELEKAIKENALLSETIRKKDENIDKLVKELKEIRDERNSTSNVKDERKQIKITPTKIEKDDDDILIISSDEEDDDTVETSSKLIRLSYGNCKAVKAEAVVTENKDNEPTETEFDQTKVEVDLKANTIEWKSSKKTKPITSVSISDKDFDELLLQSSKDQNDSPQSKKQRLESKVQNNVTFESGHKPLVGNIEEMHEKLLQLVEKNINTEPAEEFEYLKQQQEKKDILSLSKNKNACKEIGCHSSYSSGKSLDQHKKSAHLRLSHKCNQCNSEFTTKQHLNTHLKSGTNNCQRSKAAQQSLTMDKSLSVLEKNKDDDLAYCSFLSCGNSWKKEQFSKSQLKAKISRHVARHFDLEIQNIIPQFFKENEEKCFQCEASVVIVNSQGRPTKENICNHLVKRHDIMKIEIGRALSSILKGDR